MKSYMPRTSLGSSKQVQSAFQGNSYPGIGISNIPTVNGIGNINYSSQVGTGSSGLKFPANLDENRYMIIKVFNTSVADKVTKGLTDATGKVLSDMSAAFGESLNSISESGIGGIGGVMDSLSKAGSSIMSSIKNTDFGFMGDILKTYGDVFTRASGPAGFGNAKLRADWKENIYLPLPNELQEALSNSYEEQEGWMNTILKKAGAEGAMNTVSEISAFHAKATGARQIKYWENKIQMYSGTNFREINLTWTLIPNNQQESQQIHNIIKALKIYGSPSGTLKKLFVEAPHFFSLQFMNPVFDQALSFREVVLIDVKVGYSPSAGMELFADQLPKAVTLNITFRDREPKLAQDWGGGLPFSSGSSNDQNCPGGSGSYNSGAGGGSGSTGSTGSTGSSASSGSKG